MTPTFAVADYIDVTPAAGRTSIRDQTFVDPCLLAIICQEINPTVFEVTEGYEPIVPLALIPLRFLMGRFPSMTSFRYSAGPTTYFRQSLPILATYQQDASGEYLWALTLDVEIERQGPSRARE